MLVVDDTITSYTDQGPDDAPAIVFVHGFPLDKSMWNMQVDLLKEKYRVVTYDIRGHGNTDKGTEPFSVELFANDLIALMDKLGIGKASVCGLSMGGYIALHAMKKQPGRFESLILADTTCVADSPETKEKRIAAMDNIRQNGSRKYAEETVRNLFAPESIENEPETVGLVREMVDRMTEESLVMTLKALAARNETCSFLPEIKIPALIMVGEKDRITPPESARSLQEKIEKSQLFIIASAGHLSNLEQPGEFNRHLASFLDMVYKKDTPPPPAASEKGSLLLRMRDKLAALLVFRVI